MTDLSQQKKELRREYKARRAELDKAQKERFDAIICDNIVSLDCFKAAHTLLTYAPIASEIDINPIAAEALRLGKSVAYPVCDTDSSTLTFRYISDLSELVCGSYSIPEPPEYADIFRDNESAICIVPALAIDKQGFRLGYGKGYYDRFLTNFSGIAISALYSDFIANELPRDKYDIPIELIVTERGNIIINAEKGKI